MTVTYDLDTWREGDQVFSAMAKCVGGAYVLAEDYEALQSELAERQENLNVQDGVIAGLKEEIAALKSAPLFNALANKQEARIAALEKVAEAAAQTCKEVGRYGLATETALYTALRSAGYLKEEGDG